MNTIDKIKASGLKATLTRVIIYDIVKQAGHCSIDEIVKTAHQQISKVTLSTVYRVLDSFCEAGLLSKFSHPDGKVIYDITTSEHGHIFDSAHTITDMADPELMDIISRHIKEKISDNEEIDKISIQIITRKKM